MKLKAEEIQSNWDRLMGHINTHIESPRKEKVIEFYEKYQERLMPMMFGPSLKWIEAHSPLKNSFSLL